MDCGALDGDGVDGARDGAEGVRVGEGCTLDGGKIGIVIGIDGGALGINVGWAVSNCIGCTVGVDIDG